MQLAKSNKCVFFQPSELLSKYKRLASLNLSGSYHGEPRKQLPSFWQPIMHDTRDLPTTPIFTFCSSKETFPKKNGHISKNLHVMNAEFLINECTTYEMILNYAFLVVKFNLIHVTWRVEIKKQSQFQLVCIFESFLTVWKRFFLNLTQSIRTSRPELARLFHYNKCIGWLKCTIFCVIQISLRFALCIALHKPETCRLSQYKPSRGFWPLQYRLHFWIISLIEITLVIVWNTWFYIRHVKYLLMVIEND